MSAGIARAMCDEPSVICLLFKPSMTALALYYIIQICTKRDGVAARGVVGVGGGRGRPVRPRTLSIPNVGEILWNDLHVIIQVHPLAK
jgi:hypothetical protein